MDDNLASETTCGGVSSTRLHHITTSEHQDMELTHNQAYVTTRNIPLKTNECYSTTCVALEPDYDCQVTYCLMDFLVYHHYIHKQCMDANQSCCRGL